MRAVRNHEAGTPDVLQIDEIPRPTPGPGEVLVDVRAASINPTDAKRRQRGAGPLPKTTGSDFAGVVEAVGEEVTEFTVGDRVCGTGLHTTRFQQGSFADYVAVPTDVVTHLPEGISYEDGAAVALVGVTAWRGLRDHGGLEPADTCLVHGGTGGVGHVAVQFAHRLCTHTVATAHPDRLDAAEGFGADTVISYQREDLLEAVTDVSERGYDVVFDHRAGDYFTFDLEAAAFDGNVVHYGGVEGEVDLSYTALRKNLSMHVMTMSNLATSTELPRIASVLRRVLDLVDQDVIAPEIARRYSLEEASEAHRAILEDSFVGKLVVAP